MDKLSLLHPADVEPEYRQLPEETVHDLSFETILPGIIADRRRASEI